MTRRASAGWSNVGFAWATLPRLTTPKKKSGSFIAHSETAEGLVIANSFHVSSQDHDSESVPRQMPHRIPASAACVTARSNVSTHRSCYAGTATVRVRNQFW
jgi:hypothetical protein